MESFLFYFLRIPAYVDTFSITFVIIMRRNLTLKFQIPQTMQVKGR